jgi:SNF2 family DNA or RNA helicase
VNCIARYNSFHFTEKNGHHLECSWSLKVVDTKRSSIVKCQSCPRIFLKKELLRGAISCRDPWKCFACRPNAFPACDFSIKTAVKRKRKISSKNAIKRLAQGKDRQDPIVLDSDNESSSSSLSDDKRHSSHQARGGNTESRRRNIQKIRDITTLSQQTQNKHKEEEERLERLRKRQEMIRSRPVLHGQEVSLNPGRKPGEVDVKVTPEIGTRLLKHQVEGIQFMFDNLFESMDKAKTEEGNGCILSHMMGLGKTLQAIAFLHTFWKCEQMGTHILILAPVNVLINWKNEIDKWIYEVVIHFCRRILISNFHWRNVNLIIYRSDRKTGRRFLSFIESKNHQQQDWQKLSAGRMKKREECCL